MKDGILLDKIPSFIANAWIKYRLSLPMLENLKFNLLADVPGDLVISYHVVLSGMVVF